MIKRGAELRARETVPGLENRETWDTRRYNQLSDAGA